MPDLTVVKPQGASALARLVDDYLAACRARGLAPRTIKEAYGYPLRRVFLPFCAEQGVETASAIDRRFMDRLSSHLLEEGGSRGPLSRFTVHSYLSAINAFLTWARQEGEVGPNVKAQRPKLPKHLVDVLSRDDIQRLEDAAATERDKLIVRVLADTGIRVSELTGLRTTDIQDETRRVFLRVRGKGDKERMVPMLPALGRRVRRYAQKGRPFDTSSDRIFLSLRRRPGGDYEPLTRSGVDQMLRALAERAQMTKRVHAHVFRHSFATYSLTRGMNPVQLAQIMGHSSLAMIQSVYSHLSSQDAYEALLKALGGES